jgi:hypothetical protein
MPTVISPVVDDIVIRSEELNGRLLERLIPE